VADGPLLGALLDLDVGAVAAGGSCVARHGATGRVVFVRHALPGERVRALVTEDRGGPFCRADAIEIHTPAPQRVDPPCIYAGPGRCGGCDWQHVAGPAQRELKAAVIRDQFTRIGGIELDGVFDVVEELPGGLLGWRTRITYAVDRAGRPGLRRHASHAVEHVARCLLGAPGVGDAAVLGDTWPGLEGVEVIRGDDGELSTLAHRAAGARLGSGASRRGSGAPRRRRPDTVELIAGPAEVARTARGHDLRVAAGGFWQVHPAALDTLAGALLSAVEPAPGDTVLELYAGAGALTGVLADAVGPTGSVLGIEGDRQAVSDAATNLSGWPWARVRASRIDPTAIADAVGRHTPDLVVLDPPRAGAGPQVMAALAALPPRVIGYVSCDPGTLARDVAAARESGWRLRSLRAFDAYPMTHHVECVATLIPDSGVGGDASRTI
jgi:tRNA/tmRNA/rRNA uracil-C5-methylase (TrmA/RlmC/RlmD family)